MAVIVREKPKGSVEWWSKTVKMCPTMKTEKYLSYRRNPFDNKGFYCVR